MKPCWSWMEFDSMAHQEVFSLAFQFMITRGGFRGIIRVYSNTLDGLDCVIHWHARHDSCFSINCVGAHHMQGYLGLDEYMNHIKSTWSSVLKLDKRWWRDIFFQIAGRPVSRQSLHERKAFSEAVFSLSVEILACSHIRIISSTVLCVKRWILSGNCNGWRLLRSRAWAWHKMATEVESTCGIISRRSLLSSLTR